MKNIALSVHQKLINKATKEKIPLSVLNQYYAMERFLSRLSKSKYADKFVLKGGLLFWAWKVPFRRATIDIDFYFKQESSLKEIESIFKEIALTKEDDGLTFDAESIKSEFGKNDDILQFSFKGYFGEIRKDKKGAIAMKIDIGLNGIIFPKEQLTGLPSLLSDEVTFLNGYTKESVIAEKLEAITTNGMLNSRIKDFTDLYLLSKNFEFEGTALSEAINLSFNHHKIKIEQYPDGFSEQFISLKQKDWNNHRQKSTISAEGLPENFREVVDQIKSFLVPVINELSQGKIFKLNWNPKSKWV